VRVDEAARVNETGLPVTAAATFAATMVDEWVRSGIGHAVVSPGSRSTPMALALASDTRLATHVHHDERSGAFTALGIAIATGMPCIVLTTSGTGAAELHPAVAEAHLARVPLVVCTADRPPELRGVGAPQTIDQSHLFGTAVRWFCDPGVPDDAHSAAWRSVGARAVAEACGPSAGPVHLNLPFRDPLVGRAGDLPDGREAELPWHDRLVAPRRIAHDDATRLAARCRHRTGVIVAGTGIHHPEHVLLLAHTLGWPVLADPRSGCRMPDRAVVAHFDAIVRANAVDVPEVVIRLGMPPASKILATWLADNVDTEIVIDRDGWFLDPDRKAAFVVEADPCVACLELAPLLEDGGPPTPWLDRWVDVDAAVSAAIERVIDASDAMTEPAIARAVVAGVPDDGTLVVASSMPIRDVEWFAEPREGARIVANRGANGIDGVVSTAVGVALTGVPTIALLGDIAFLHDSNGLLGAHARAMNLTIVVVDNDGGGIFSFLPQARAMASERFEQLFGTPHGLDLRAVAEAFGARAHDADDDAQLRRALDKCAGSPGVDVIVVRTDRADNVAVHDAIHAATTDAATAAWNV
jgi:2-succinyl-5-enolpyruvyl-6-hydroxy-3-cyclohexene-1-carboxylate synthase